MIEIDRDSECSSGQGISLAAPGGVRDSSRLTTWELAHGEDGIDFERYIEGIELSLIKRSLERTRGNKRQAARLLNLKRTTLIEKLKRLEPHQATE